MRIHPKILLTLLGMSALVVLVGGFAVNRLETVGALGLAGAAREAADVARTLGFAAAADQDPSHCLTIKVVRNLHKILGRDVKVVDVHRRILADATPGQIGTIAPDFDGKLDRTLSDGLVRTFNDLCGDHPQGICRIAVPVKSEAGQIVGAVLLECPPDYNEMVAITQATRLQVIYAALASVGIATILALYIGTSIASPLRQLTRAAVSFAAGEEGLSTPRHRADEIGDLSVAFEVMMERRTQAKEELRRAMDELERRVEERTAKLGEANDRLQREVAERRGAEENARRLAEEIAQEREWFAEILNSVPAVVFEHWSLEQSRRNFVSRYVETLHGYTSEEWLSAPDFWTRTIHPEDKERVLQAAERAFAGDGFESESDVFRWITKDNRVVWAETHRRMIRKNGSGIVGVRGFTVDITDRKRAEEELRKMHEQLVEASRKAGMAEVATNVLHNVGNVLNSVNVSAAVAADHVRQSSAQHVGRVAALLREHAVDLGGYLSADPVGQKLPGFIGQLAAQLETEQAAILQELDQLGRNVEHIKDIVSVQQSYASAAGVSQTVAVVDLVEDCLRMNTGALTRHEVQLLREYEARPTIRVDKHKVMQILVNLIRNAKYACDESGRALKHLTVRITEDEQAVRISVIDNGVGIPAENMTRIFSHGFTTRQSGHGFGLHSGALAAAELGGKLIAQSEGPGRGATFTLELPFQSQAS
jgi:PAS domain S-box-containing protein